MGSFATASTLPPATSDQADMGTSAIHSERYRAFLTKLRQAREDSGLTQRQVAEQLGRLQSFVEKSEQGQRRVDAA